ncbi:MAG TPA: sulfotransferase [Terriglobia bacterium]|nr:sulfotransferase [Terriglobia bacterium]
MDLPSNNNSDNSHPATHPPIFVVGVWRSGTTLLYTLLNQHPDIRLFYEGDLPVLWPIFKFPWSRKTWVEKWEYWNAGISRHDLDPTRLTEPVTSLSDAAELAGRQYCSHKGASIWGCKSPSYYNQLVSLAREFPRARFIVIWRDPEEICRSVIRAAESGLWFSRPGMTHKALLASRILKRQCDRLVASGAALHQIYYQDLVEKTGPTMHGICEFLRVPFDPSVTVLNKADRSALFQGAHHNLAKSNKIVSRKEPKGPLPAELAAKILRYKTLWRRSKGSDSWLLCQRFTHTGSDVPGIWERLTDRLLFAALRLWDSAPRLLFSVLPISVWQTYRKLKYKDAEWVHRQLTDKPTTLHVNPEASASGSHAAHPEGAQESSPDDVAAVH